MIIFFGDVDNIPSFFIDELVSYYVFYLPQIWIDEVYECDPLYDFYAYTEAV